MTFHLPRRRTAVAAVAALGCAVGAVSAVADPVDTSPVAISQTPPDSALVAGCLDPGNHADADVEPALAVNPRDPDNLVAAWWTGETDFAKLARLGGYAVTHDGGHSWTTDFPRGIDGCGGDRQHDQAGAHDPWVSFGSDGRAYMLFESGGRYTNELCRQVGMGPDECPIPPTSTAGVTDPGEQGLANTQWLLRSDDGGRTWQQPIDVLDSSVTGGPVDQARLLVDPANSDTVYLFWRQEPPTDALTVDSAVHDAADVIVSHNGGRTWSKSPVTVYEGATGLWAINPVSTHTPDGKPELLVVLGTVDQTPAAGALTGTGGLASVPQSILASRSLDGGRSWTTVQIGQSPGQQGLSQPGRFPRAAAQPGTAWWMKNPPTVAVAPDGTVYAVWGDKTQPGEPGSVDISSSSDGGANWSAPRQLPATSALGLNAVAVAGDGTLGVLHFDQNPTSDSEHWTADVYLARSFDKGTTWSDEHVAGPFDLTAAPAWENMGPYGNVVFLGDYINLVGLPHGFAAAFPMTTPTAPNSNPTDIYFGRWNSRSDS